MEREKRNSEPAPSHISSERRQIDINRAFRNRRIIDNAVDSPDKFGIAGMNNNVLIANMHAFVWIRTLSASLTIYKGR